jgi:ABC-type multidrug transport system ATPase subunit/transposase
VVIDPPTACACCGGNRLRKLGEDVTQTLETTPRRCKVIETVREKFSCRDCETISQAPAPFHVIPRGWAGPSLLAMIVFEKFGQHQPLNRQAERYALEGAPIALSTMADAVGAVSTALDPLGVWSTYSRLSVQGLEGATLHDLSFDMRRGEIVGVAGLGDSGVAELPRILAGLEAPIGGRISVGGKPVSPRATPRTLIRAGMVVLPADRLRSGGVATLSVAENIFLPDLARFWSKPRHEAEFIKRIIARLNVRPASAATLFGKLSGGNQQKAILAKWLALKPRVLVLDDPTNGVDPGARQTIFQLLREAAANGIGVLVFSTEPEQLAAFCSPVLILREGEVASELTGEAVDRQTISRWCYA